MAIKGVGAVKTIDATQNGLIDITLRICGIDATLGLSNDDVQLQMDPSILGLTWQVALKNVVRNHLINNRAYTFGLLDDVRLVSESLL